MKRSLGATIDAVLAVIPDEPSNTRVRVELQKLRQSSRYTAPEVMAALWTKGTRLLRQELGAPDVEWKQRVAAIWSGKES